ncbi:MAG: hypothetical protein HOP33_21355 [Verrucomicrobia bacterium]|nr:hypothetical protein [Verrucomicrobiota bacterium]
MKLLKHLILAFSILAPAAWAQTIPNPSFEADHYFSGVGYASQNGGVITGWTISDAARIGLNLGGTNTPGLFANNGAIPNGTNVAFIQCSGANNTNTLSTTITGLTPGIQYLINFRANSRSGGTPNAAISLNGGGLMPFTCAPAVGGANPYYVNSAAFIATSNTASLRVLNGITNGDATVLLDNFSISTLGPLVVTNAGDSGPGTLRTVLASAPSGAVITFAPALSGQTILLSSGEIVLDKWVTIDASALASGIKINGTGASRIFSVNAGLGAVMNALTLTNGNAANLGGAVYCAGNVVLSQCSLTGNCATNSTGWGGALYVEANGAAMLNGCTLSGNRAKNGGAILSYIGSSLTLNQCTVAGNTAALDSAINCSTAQTLTINQSTICSNASTAGGATISAAGTRSMTNSILFGLNNDPDLEVAVIEGFQMVSHNLVGVNPMLSPLGNYGGRTQTMPPLPGSPANNDGDDSITNSFATDQRGLPRAIGFHVDIGSVEATNAPFVPTILTLPASVLTFTSAVLNASVSIGGTNTTCYFQYGLTTSYGNVSDSITINYSGLVGITVTNVSLTNLYHFRAVAFTSAGTNFGGDIMVGGLEMRTWIPLANAPPDTVGHLHLLSDGTVLAMHDTTWYRLTPDSTGSYVNGTWSSTAPMADTRFFYASQLLQDGRLLVAGGEYGTGGNKSEIFDPVLNTWTQISVPTNLSVNISDATSMMLPDGSVMVAPVSPATNNLTIIYNPADNTWTNGPPTLGGQNEVSWVKLPDDSILTVDILSTNAERYIPGLNKWISDAGVPVPLYSRYGAETGPAMLLPNGKVIFFGDHGPNALYTPSGNTNFGTWQAAPSFPNGQGMPDAPCAMLVDGKVVCATAPSPTPDEVFNEPVSFFEYDYLSNKLTQISAPGGGTVYPGPAYPNRMLNLPDGTALYNPNDSPPHLYVYRPQGLALTNAQPVVRSISANADGSLHFSGTTFNGISAGAAYGDDEQEDSNYPLVRFTDGNGIVRYGRTYNWSSTGVWTGTNVVTTECAIPDGASLQDKVEVVANGIASPQLSYPIALDTTGLTWSSSGNINWGIQTSVTHDGADAARSGAIADSQSSSLATTVSGPGALMFWWKVSSETNFDSLRFYLDAVEQPAAPRISGEVNWQQRVVTVPAGSHSLTWTYAKDGSLFTGSDAGWLDQVAFIPTTISTTNDSGPGSLRDIVAALPTGYAVTFDPSLSGRRIVLTSGQITLSNNLSMDASALAGGLTISGNNASRVFLINPGVTSVLSGLTITGGNAVGPAPFANYGGAIFNQGNLTLSNCYVVANSGFAGGGIFNSGGNRLTLHASTFATNSASYGGAIQNEGVLLADNTTFNANSASQQGGAISAPFSSPVGLLQCTVSGNNGGDGGGILGAAIAITNSIVAGNTATINSNLSGSFITGGNNLTNSSPLLAALANYGGPTPTLRPLIGSPAIDAGNDASASGLSFDQRGRSRTSGIHVDLGAVEVTTNSIVTTIADSGAGSLRTVVANIEPGFTITFANSLAGQTILLTTGQIVLDKNSTIDGSGSSIQISGNNLSRIFFVNSGINATLNGLSLINGLASQGGAIQNLGSLTLNQCALAGNQDNCACGINGGAILNRGSLVANNSTFSGNTARFGGAIFNDQSSTLTVNQSTFSGNVGTNGGGAIYNFNGTMTVKQSTVVGNQSPGGGAQGGGINNTSGGFFLTNSIVCANTASSSPNIAGVVTPFTSPNNLVDTNPLLAALGNNGGPTLTMPPLAGSPALDAGNDAVAGSFPTDQRGVGFPRVSGAHVDIGAVEFQVPIIIATNPPVLTGLTKLGDGTFRFSFTNLTGASFTVFASTNVALPFNAWSNLGPAVETPASSGQFQFTDPQATNNPQRFYRVKSP